MKILVIGGTEFFGKVLVEQLLRENHEVTILTRGNKKPSSFWSKISHIECERGKHDEFKEKLKNKHFDVVVDNVVRDQADVESVIDVFASRLNPPQYILCSSVAVYPEWQNEGVLLEEDVTFDIDKKDDWKVLYANGKRKAERCLLEKHGDMPYTIMRPTVIEGPCDPHKRTWFWVQRIQDNGPIILPTSELHTLYRHVSARDVAQAFILAAGNSKAYNKTYNVAGKEVLSIKEYVSRLAAELGCCEVELCWIPTEQLCTKLSNYFLPPFFENVRLIPDINKIENDLGYSPQNTETYIYEIIQALKNEAGDSIGYEDRDLEIELSQEYKKNNEVIHVVEQAGNKVRIR